MQPGIGPQLIQDERRNVCARYRAAPKLGEFLKRPDRVAAGLVIQDGGANENPVDAAVPDDRFLPVFVGIDLAQQKREYQSVEEKAAVSGTLAGAHPRDAHQA